MATDIEATAQRIHDMLRSAPGTSRSHRALHAKGLIASGSFEASGALEGLTTAPHLLDGSTPALVRFSHPGGDPHVSDALPSGRGFAVKLRGEAAHDLVTVSSPAFLVRDGASFIELLAARAPDPETGAPDPGRIGEFLAAHPEALPAIEAVMTAPIPESYATITYRSLHTFFLVDRAGTRRPFRFTFSPVAGDAAIDPGLAGTVAPDHLREEMAERLVAGPASFDLLVHLGEPEDPTDDPTAIWPERPTVVAGRLDVTAIADDAEPVIFDPTNVPAGVAIPDGDEILALRRAVYGLSYAQRTA